MILTKRLSHAINRASELHREQLRRGKDMTPYISHLYGVMYLLSKVTEDEDVLIAGLLHDSLEDVPLYTKEKLIEEFGEKVGAIVSGVTEPLDANKEVDDQKPWLERKEAYLEALKNGPTESALVSLSDKIHNLMSTEYSIETRDALLFQKIEAGFRHQKLFYEKVFEIAKAKLGEDHMLVREFETVFKRVSALLMK
jgi:(p)ppGpp synthase/HD superfamily hydrolase